MRYLAFLLPFIGTLASAQFPPYVAEGFDADDPGYFFLTSLRFGGPNSQSQAMILDGGGNVVFRHRIPNVSNFRAWPDGRMSYSARGKHILIDQSFALLDSVSCADGILNDLHELRILENGHFILLGMENLTMDLSSYPVFQHGTESGSSNALVRSGVIQELNAAKELIWQWRAVDHFDFLDADTSRLLDPSNVDWTHFNAIDVEEDGNLLVSARNFNEITKIDRSADTIIWRLGGARNQFQFPNDTGFFLQHDARRLSSGHVTLFDNSKAGAHPGRAVEYELDEVGMTATKVWSHEFGPGTYSRAMGSAQRMSSGNTLIGWGALTPENVAYSVVGPDGTVISELIFPDTLITYRAYYFPELSFAIERPLITCAVEGALFRLTAEHTNPGFRWSTGQMGPTILIPGGDTVHVEVPTGSGGFIRSRPFAADASCTTTGVEGVNGNDIKLYPNPAWSVIQVSFNGEQGSRKFELRDALGRILWRAAGVQGDVTIPLMDHAPGLYSLVVDGVAHRIVKSAP